MPDFEQAHAWLVSGEASLGDDLDRGAARSRTGRSSSRASPEARRRRSSRSSSPARAGRREPHGRRRRRLERDRAGDGARRSPRRATPSTPRRGGRSTSRRVTAHRLDFTDADAVDAFAARVRARRRADHRRGDEHPAAPPARAHARVLGPHDRREPQRPVLRAARVPARARGGARDGRDHRSVSGAYTDRSGPAYQASKAGAIALTTAPASRSTARCAAPAILPGVVDTEILDNRPEPPDAETRAQMLHAEDVAAACVFAVSLPPRAYVAGAHDPADCASGDREDDVSRPKAGCRARSGPLMRMSDHSVRGPRAGRGSSACRRRACARRRRGRRPPAARARSRGPGAQLDAEDDRLVRGVAKAVADAGGRERRTHRGRAGARRPYSRPSPAVAVRMPAHAHAAQSAMTTWRGSPIPPYTSITTLPTAPRSTASCAAPVSARAEAVQRQRRQRARRDRLR